MTYKVERNIGTDGFCCHFEHNGRRYYADVSEKYTGFPECMIFPQNKWDELYVNYDMEVSPEGLISCIDEFIRQLEETA